MRKSQRFTLFFILAIITIARGSFAAKAPGLRARTGSRLEVVSPQKFIPGQVLVRFRNNTSITARAALHGAVKATVAKRFQAVPSLELVHLPASTGVLDALRQYRADPNVLYAEPNFMVRALDAPNDPLYPKQWHLNNTAQLGGGVAGADIHAPQAWSKTSGSKSAVVMTIDSGIDYNHPDLAPNVYRNAADCNSNGVDEDGDGYADDCYGIDTVAHDSDPMDDNGHGTHVAGLIGAAGNDGIGVAGINWNVQIIACKFLDSNGNGSVAGAVECLDYAKKLKSRGVNIIATNNSWGGIEFSQALVDAIDQQRQAGILFITAAGNDFSDNDTAAVFPANISLPNVISVAATTDSDRLALFSNTGRRTVHLAAPGQELLSTLPYGTYGTMTGTSMAAPLVTGVAALIASQNPSLSWMDIKNLILAGGDSLAELQPATVTGKRLNAYGALTCASAPVMQRLKPVQLSNAGAVGSPIVISYLNINCAKPVAGQLQVAVSTGEIVTLTDDGAGADSTAGDGVFTGSWTPSQTGSYSLTLPDGDTMTVQVLTNYHAYQDTSSYREIAGTSLNLSDDSVGSFTSPFPIQFGQGSFDRIYVASDGTISFTDAFDSFHNRFLPLANQQQGWDLTRYWDSSVVTMLAPYWDDLYPVPNTDQNVFWDVLGAAPNRELVIEWRNVRYFDCHGDPSKTVTFEVVLAENSANVLYLYKNLQSGCVLHYMNHDFGGSATVGLQIAPSVGATWYNGPNISYAGTLASNTVLRWQLVTDPVPSNPVPAVSSISPNYVPANSGNTLITINGSNFIPGSTAYFDPADPVFNLPLLTTYVNPTLLTAVVPSIVLTQPYYGQHHIGVSNPAPGGGASNTMPFGVGIEPAVITSLSPASAVAGGPTFTLTINGTGFGNGAVNPYVSWNSLQLNGRWISSTQVQVDISAANIAKAGTANISMYVNGWGGSNTVVFPITATSGTGFVNAGPESTTTQAKSKPYRFLGWANSNSFGEEYMKRFSRPFAGASQFAANQSAQSGLPSLPTNSPLPGIALRPSMPTGYLPSSVAMADFNGDGKMDWAVANAGDNSVWIYMGRGDGTWDLPRIIRLRGLSPVAIIAADLRGKGIRDLLIAEIDSLTLGVLKGKGDGTFEDEAEYFLPAPPTFLCPGDFDNDGKLDVVVGTLGTAKQGALYMLHGDGTGSLGDPVSLPDHKRVDLTSPSAAWLAMGDFDNDGFLDITASEPFFDPSSESGVLSYLNRKDGSFKEAQEVFDNWIMPNYGVAAGDINEDGCMDLVVVVDGGFAIPYLGNCNGTFTQGAESYIGLGDFSYGIKLADINGDGHLDLIAAGVHSGLGGGGYGNDSNTLLTVAPGKGNGWFGQPGVFRGGSGAFMFDVGDVNGDGKPDIITANQDSDSATLFLNQGNGDFGSPAGQYVGYLMDGRPGPANSPLSEPIAADITGNHRLDIGYFESQRANPDGTMQPLMITVLPSLGGGKFGPPVRSPIVSDQGAYVIDLLFADFRKSGHADLLAVTSGINNQGDSYVFAPANSDGSFGTPVRVQTATNWGALGSGDFNGDGKLDFVAADMGSGGLRLTVYLGNNDGTFRALPPTVLPGTFATRPYAVYVGDFNKDGKLDVLVWLAYNVAPATDHDVYEFLGKGDGTFLTGTRVLQNMAAFRLADLNHDGLPDVVETRSIATTTSNQFMPQVRVFLGQADGSFNLKYTYAPYSGIEAPIEEARAVIVPPATSRLADFDGDGQLDLAVYQKPAPGVYESYVQFMKGNGDGSFTPTYNVNRLDSPFVPYLAADFDGDGIADLFDLVSFSSSWNLIRGKRAPAIQLSLLSDPVPGTQGTVRVTMNAPADQAVTLNLQGSDPGIVVPATVAIPAGTNFVDVPFQIGDGFDNTRVFSITASGLGQSANVYGTQLPHGMSGFAVSSTAATSYKVLAGETFTYGLAITSKMGWGGVLTASCVGLPSGASCAVPAGLELRSGGWIPNNLQLALSSSMPLGTYTFSYVVSDGTNQASIQLGFTVGDFSVQVSPTIIHAFPNAYQGAMVNLPSVQGYSEVVNLSCDGLPSTVYCTPTFGFAGSFAQLSLSTQAIPAADYPFTIVGTSHGVTRNGSATLRVQDVTTSLDKTSVSLKSGESTNATLTVSAPNGFSEEVTVSCVSSSPVSCSLAPATVSFSDTADSKAVQITLKANASSSAVHAGREEARHDRSGRSYAIFAPLLAVGLLLMHNRPARKLAVSSSILLVSFGMLSCGGGGAGNSGGTTPPPVPPPTSKTVVVYVNVSSTSIWQRQAGAITVTVQQ